MRSRLICLYLALIGTLLFSSHAQSVASATPPPESRAHVTRVFYLQDVGVREAVTLCRSGAHLLKMASIESLNVVVTSDVVGKIEECEKLLREADAQLRSVDPHEPIDFNALRPSAVELRIFELRTTTPNRAVTLLRSIYQLTEVTEVTDSSVSVRAAVPILEASEAQSSSSFRASQTVRLPQFGSSTRWIRTE